MVLSVAPTATLVSLVAWATVLATVRIMSVASLSAAAVFPIAVVATSRDNVPLLICGSVMAGFIVFTHRSNIRRLVAGTEPRLSRSGGEGR